MKILIVHAHEHTDSFCSAFAKAGKAHLQSLGHTVTLSDLYAKGFTAEGSAQDFTHTPSAEHYKYASEQLYAHQNGTFIPSLKAEMDALHEADMVNFNFPLWWFGMPAILKGWVDRVLAYGFAYGGDYGFFNTGRFAGKKAFITLTTGSPQDFYTLEGTHGRTIDDILRNIHQGIFGLIGYEVLTPFVGYGVSQITQKEREQLLVDYKAYLTEHCG